MTIGAKKPIVIVNSSMLRSFDEKEVATVLAHESAHVLSEHYTYTTALVLLSQFLLGALPRSLLLGLPVRAMYLALLEWSRAAELSADRAAALVMADPLQPCRVLMALAGGSIPGMNFEAFLQQASEYDGEDDLFSRHTRFWSELNLTHPVAVRRVKELMEWVDSGAYERIRDGDYPRRGEEPPTSQEFDDAVEHYRERFARILDRVAGGVEDIGRRLGSWLDRFQNTRGGDEEREDLS
jgi:Zn-dependent protease with chaperone function